ncbi:MAG: hypothetical protein OHK0013_42150 [Sandaracinaceae bacterium]
MTDPVPAGPEDALASPFMTYSGAATARGARENLGRSLAALQEDPNIPPDVLAVAQNLAQAVGSLFEAERASSEPDGKAAVKAALGLIGQTLALLQDVRGQHRGIQLATETLAGSMSMLYPLTQTPSMRPPMAAPANAPMMGVPAPVTPATAPQPSAPAPTAGQMTQALHPQQPRSPSQAAVPAQAGGPSAFSQPYAQPAPQPAFSQPQPAFSQPQPAFSQPQPAFSQPQPAFSQPQPAFSQPAARPQPAAQQPQQGTPEPVGYRGNQHREAIEVNIGATTESNFFVGFSGEIAEGGVFAATYNIFPRATPMRVHITLPGGFDRVVNGVVKFVRDPMDLSADDAVPGMGIQFEGLDAESRELILRFVRKRPPMFYDE